MTFLVTAITEYAIVYNLWRRPIEQLYRQQQKGDKYISQQVFCIKQNRLYTHDLDVFYFAYIKSTMGIHEVHLSIYVRVASLAPAI